MATIAAMPELKNQLVVNTFLVPYERVEDTVYIAIRPSCAATGVDYSGQWRILREHAYLKDHVREMQMVVYGAKTGGDGGSVYEPSPTQRGAVQAVTDFATHLRSLVPQRRTMLGLPLDKYLPWLMTLPTRQPHHEAYKWACYNVVWTQFTTVGAVQRTQVRELTQIEREMDALKQSMANDENYARLLQLQHKHKQVQQHIQRDMKNGVAQMKMQFTERNDTPLLN